MKRFEVSTTSGKPGKIREGFSVLKNLAIMSVEKRGNPKGSYVNFESQNTIR